MTDKYEVQKKVIVYLEEHRTATRREIIKSLSEYPENSIYRAIQKLRKDRIVVDTKQKSILNDNSSAKWLVLDEENPKYIEFNNKHF